MSEGLLSKWGFNDGDLPDEVIDYLEERFGNEDVRRRLDWHRLLIDLVRAHLLPALDQEVTVVEIVTIHNPIRAEWVDGVDVSDFWYHNTEPRPTLNPESVSIPIERVLDLARAQLGVSP